MVTLADSCRRIQDAEWSANLPAWGRQAGGDRATSGTCLGGPSPALRCPGRSHCQGLLRGLPGQVHLPHHSCFLIMIVSSSPPSGDSIMGAGPGRALCGPGRVWASWPSALQFRNVGYVMSLGGSALCLRAGASLPSPQPGCAAALMVCTFCRGPLPRFYPGPGLCHPKTRELVNTPDDSVLCERTECSGDKSQGKKHPCSLQCAFPFQE